jgi:hypothetical protein
MNRQVTVEKFEPLDEGVGNILQLAATNPRLAFIELFMEIESELGKILARAGFLDRGAFVTASSALRLFQTEYPVLPDSMLDALNALVKIRNSLVHNRSVDPDDIVRSLDSGLTLLKALRGMAVTRFVVTNPGLDVFTDSEGRTIREGWKAVIVEEISTDGTQRTKHVLPTTQTHFAPGMEVAWDWNFDLRIGESWYRSPESGEIERAWTSSVEFLGSDLQDLRRKIPNND